jgi:hypothetical protein
MKTIIALIFCSLLVTYIWADDFKYKSKVDTVSKPGFYKIVLSPEIISESNPEYSDIRIFDSKHNEVPYILSSEQKATERTGFKEYELLENNYLPKQKITRVVVHNPSKKTLSALTLIVRNSDVEKEITLKGSDDKSHWYIIKSDFPVHSDDFYEGTSQKMVFNFPGSNYEFFELTMNDKKKDPIQIIKVGYYDSEVAKGLYTAIPDPAISQTDSIKVKKSYIRLTFDRPYEISKLEVSFTGPELFMRQCYLGLYASSHKKQVFEEFVSFTASSKFPSLCEFEKIKNKELTVIIENLDNPPLKVIKAKAYQLNKYLIVSLKPHEEYYIYFGNSKLQAPIYDLAYFSDSIAKSISDIRTSPIIDLYSAGKKQNVFFNKTTVWIAIGVIILLLGWFTIRLAQDVNKEKRSN